MLNIVRLKYIIYLLFERYYCSLAKAINKHEREFCTYSRPVFSVTNSSHFTDYDRPIKQRSNSSFGPAGEILTTASMR